MKTNILLSAMCILLLNSCIKKRTEYPTGENYLIFGHFYGMCVGEQCREIFKLQNNTIAEDTLDLYPSRTAFYDGAYLTLSQQKHDAVKDIVNYFPQSLLSEPNAVIGQPDVSDGGGLYVEYNYDGVRKFWLLDNNKSNVPVPYHGFMDKIVEKVSLLQ